MTMKGQPILPLLPHRGGMVLLDHLLSWSETRAVAGVTIRPDNLFCREGGVPGHLAIEMMAQCCAAFAGEEARRAGRPVRIGYLVAVRACTIARDRFGVGEALTVSADLLYRDDHMASFTTAIVVDRTTAASARLTVYQSSDMPLPTPQAAP